MVRSLWAVNPPLELQGQVVRHTPHIFGFRHSCSIQTKGRGHSAPKLASRHTGHRKWSRGSASAPDPASSARFKQSCGSLAILQETGSGHSLLKVSGVRQPPMLAAEGTGSRSFSCHTHQYNITKNIYVCSQRDFTSPQVLGD